MTAPQSAHLSSAPQWCAQPMNASTASGASHCQQAPHPVPAVRQAVNDCVLHSMESLEVYRSKGSLDVQHSKGSLMCSTVRAPLTCSTVRTPLMCSAVRASRCAAQQGLLDVQHSRRCSMVILITGSMIFVCRHIIRQHLISQARPGRSKNAGGFSG